MQKIITFLALSAVLTSASATDLGVQGKIWPIIEVDFRQLLLESAARADLPSAQQEVQSSADKYFDNLPRRDLPSSETTVTKFIDPSISLSSDIMIPTPGSKGDYQWSTYYSKGSRVNPLEKYRPLTAMLFFDGRNPAQLDFVKEVLKANPMRIVPVETAGANVKSLSKTFNRPIFYANESMMARFKVEYLPSLLYPGSGEHALYLGLTAFASPYSQKEVEAVWPVQGSGTVTGTTTPAVTDEEKQVIKSLLNINPKPETGNAQKN